MWPVAIFLMLVVGFYWFAFCISVIAWLKAIGHLFGGNFIRSALWFNVGVFMLFWWTDKPHDWDNRRAVHDDLAALASALRGAIGTEQGPRRISGPTVN
jgi:hypothetical protein